MQSTVTSAYQQVDFSLVQGGPLYQLLVRVGLQRPPTELLARRIIAFLLVAWLPLLILSAMADPAVGAAGVSFLRDPAAQARLLIGMPLLLAADLFVHHRMKPVLQQFLDQGIIASDDHPRFRNFLASAMRLRDSMLAEFLLVAMAIAGGYFLGRRFLVTPVTTWHAVPVDGRSQLTLAGLWYTLVSLSILRYLLVRWYFRLLIWYRLVWQIARLPLRINPLHPDRAGGLRFLTESVQAFAPVLLAHTIGISGILAGRIWRQGATLPQLKFEIMGWLVVLNLLAVVPLFFFVPRLAAAKRRGLREYAVLGGRYVADFRRKWIEGQTPQHEKLMGTGDIQSLADLSASFEAVSKMRLAPLEPATMLGLALGTALPFLPLILTAVPLEDLIHRAMGIFF